MNPRLLIVDDEESLLDMLCLLFDDQGYEVRRASSVTQARERLAGGDFDLVLCDILMPDGNGLELLREIKAESPQTAVIMMTAYTSSKSAIEAMKLGAYNYVSASWSRSTSSRTSSARAPECRKSSPWWSGWRGPCRQS